MGTTTVAAGPARLSWDAEERLGVLRFVEQGVGGAAEAERLTASLRAWLDEDEPARYGFLVDCAEIVDADAGWRTTWGEFFQRERTRAVIGWFNANPRIRLVIIMFRKGTGVTGEAFATESEARAYVTEKLAEVGG
jgi:fructosamine-3-kinase